MRRYAGFTLLLSLAMLWGCSRTVLVPVPPRMDLKSYGTLGIVEFSSNAREEMIPALVYQLTHDFRPSSVRQPAR